MKTLIELLMKMGKTKEEALEFIGKELPTGGIDDVGSNILKPITKKVVGDYPLIGSRITDPTQQGQYGRYFLQTLDPKDRYNLIRQSIDDQKASWEKTLKFLNEGGYNTFSELQKQNLNYNLGVLQRSKIVLQDIKKGLEVDGIDVEDLYGSFVKENKVLSTEGEDILEYLNKTKEKLEDSAKIGKKQDEILKKEKKDNDARMKRLYEGRAYEKGDSFYRALGGYHLPKLHEAGIINLDPKIYEALKKGKYHHGGADFFAPDPNRILRYHFGTKIFDDLDDVIDKAAMDGEVALKGPNGMIDFLKKNDYLPFKKDGPANALDYMNDVEKLERVKELNEATKVIKSGQSNFYKTPDQIMNRVMENANDKFQYLDSLKRTHPGKFKLYEKDISEEPFFGVDIGQNDLFSDLSDLTWPKDKGDLLPFPKKEKDYDDALFDQKAKNEIEKNVNKQKEELKKIDEIEELSQDLSKESDVDKILLKSKQLKKKTEGKFTKAQVLIERLKNTIKEQPNDKYVQENFPNFIKEIEAKPELANDEGVQEAFGLTDLSETADQRLVEYPDGSLDFYTKGNKGGMESVQKLMDELGISQEEAFRIKQLEPEDQILELTKLRTLKKRKDTPDDDPDFNMAEGGRINFRSAGFISGRTKSSRSKSNQPKSPGHPGNQGGKSSTKHSPHVGGPPIILNPPPKKKTTTVTTGGKSPKPKPKTANIGGKTLLQKYRDHKKFIKSMHVRALQDPKFKNYHQLGGYDFMKRFDVNPTIAKGLGYGYQGVFEGLRSLNPFDDYSFMDAMKRAKHEGDLNALGIDAAKGRKSQIDQAQKSALDQQLNNIAKEYNVMKVNPYKYNFLADGGIASLRNKI